MLNIEYSFVVIVVVFSTGWGRLSKSKRCVIELTSILYEELPALYDRYAILLLLLLLLFFVVCCCLLLFVVVVVVVAVCCCCCCLLFVVVVVVVVVGEDWNLIYCMFKYVLESRNSCEIVECFNRRAVIFINQI